MTGQDNRKSLVVAPSISTFLQRHVDKLSTDWYVTHRGTIETYANMPNAPGGFGSVTMTNGVRVRAHAHYNHIFCQFDETQPSYVFSYQITLDVVLEEGQQFHKAKLLRRTWIIEKTPDDIDGVDNQPGVIGLYPEVSVGM